MINSVVVLVERHLVLVNPDIKTFYSTSSLRSEEVKQSDWPVLNETRPEVLSNNGLSFLEGGAS